MGLPLCRDPPADPPPRTEGDRTASHRSHIRRRIRHPSRIVRPRSSTGATTAAGTGSGTGSGSSTSDFLRRTRLDPDRRSSQQVLLDLLQFTRDGNINANHNFNRGLSAATTPLSDVSVSSSVDDTEPLWTVGQPRFYRGLSSAATTASNNITVSSSVDDTEPVLTMRQPRFYGGGLSSVATITSSHGAVLSPEAPSTTIPTVGQPRRSASEPQEPREGDQERQTDLEIERPEAQWWRYEPFPFGTPTSSDSMLQSLQIIPPLRGVRGTPDESPVQLSGSERTFGRDSGRDRLRGAHRDLDLEIARIREARASMARELEQQRELESQRQQEAQRERERHLERQWQLFRQRQLERRREMESIAAAMRDLQTTSGLGGGAGIEGSATGNNSTGGVEGSSDLRGVYMTRTGTWGLSNTQPTLGLGGDSESVVHRPIGGIDGSSWRSYRTRSDDLGVGVTQRTYGADGDSHSGRFVISGGLMGLLRPRNQEQSSVREQRERNRRSLQLLERMSAHAREYIRDLGGDGRAESAANEASGAAVPSVSRGRSGFVGDIDGLGDRERSLSPDHNLFTYLPFSSSSTDGVANANVDLSTHCEIGSDAESELDGPLDMEPEVATAVDEGRRQHWEDWVRMARAGARMQAISEPWGSWREEDVEREGARGS